MVRPKEFKDIIGHDWLVQYLTDHISKGTLHHFMIFEGPEGLGKTSLADVIALNLVYGMADSAEKDKAYETVVCKKASNDYIKKFELSVEGGKETAKEVRSEMLSTFNLKHPKVIICDECHNLSDAAQDVFLSDTEYISDKVYIIMLTTEIEQLKPTLRSRAVPIHLNTLKQSDMIKVLKAEVARKRLVIQNEDITLGMIAEWAECKPRTGLNILNAFSQGSTVSTSMLRELIGFMDIKDIIPLLASLSGSMTFGLSYISEMKIDKSIVNLVVEAVKVKSGAGSYKLKMSDIANLREQLTYVTVEQLITFLYGLTKHNKLTRTNVINAYISAHASKEELSKPDTSELINVEQAQKQTIQAPSHVQGHSQAPSLDDIMLESEVIV